MRFQRLTAHEAARLLPLRRDPVYWGKRTKEIAAEAVDAYKEGKLPQPEELVTAVLVLRDPFLLEDVRRNALALSNEPLGDKIRELLGRLTAEEE